jgi:hypothetical protein
MARPTLDQMVKDTEALVFTKFIEMIASSWQSEHAVASVIAGLLYMRVAGMADESIAHTVDEAHRVARKMAAAIDERR